MYFIVHFWNMLNWGFPGYIESFLRAGRLCMGAFRMATNPNRAQDLDLPRAFVCVIGRFGLSSPSPRVKA